MDPRELQAPVKQEAEAHPGVGGPGEGACSGDLLLGALAACAVLQTLRRPPEIASA